jgi:hypothetical protein
MLVVVCALALCDNLSRHCSKARASYQDRSDVRVQTLPSVLVLAFTDSSSAKPAPVCTSGDSYAA